MTPPLPYLVDSFAVDPEPNILAVPVVLIPAHNEAETIRTVVEAVREHTGWPVVVVDDASVDGTAAVARTAGAVVLPLPVTLGAWGAIQTGIRYARRAGYQCAVTMDGDGQHLADSLPGLLSQLRSTDLDVVIGSCPERLSRPRRWLGWVLRSMTGLQIEDLTSGLRFYNRAALDLLDSPDATLLEFQDLGVLLLLRSARLRIGEFRVSMDRRLYGRSRIFSSSSRILYYIAYNLVLCLGKRRS